MVENIAIGKLIDDVIGLFHHVESFQKAKTIEEILTPIIIFFRNRGFGNEL